MRNRNVKHGANCNCKECKRKRKAWKPKLQMEISQLKELGCTDATILQKLQLAGFKDVLTEIKHWTDRHDHRGDKLWEPRR
mgnify:CR=1 FL=1